MENTTRAKAMKINWGTGIVIAFIAFISFILFFCSPHEHGPQGES